MEDQMGDWTSVKPLYLGHPAPLVWTHMEDWVPIELRHMHHLTLLASHLGSSNVRMSPSWTGPPFTLHMMEWSPSSKNSTGNLHTSLLGPDTPALSAIYSSQTLNPGLVLNITLVKITSSFVPSSKHIMLD